MKFYSKKLKIVTTSIFILIVIFVIVKPIYQKNIETNLISPTVDQPQKTTTKKKETKVTPFTCPIPKKEYDDMSLLNIGQITSLPDTTYIPKDLVKMNTKSSVKNICLIKETKEAFELMITNAKKDGLTIKASSGFRSYEYQKILLENTIKNGSKDANVSIAKAGYSEHQLGTAVDITSSSINYDSSSGNFYKTPESDWLKENAYLYGFIQSYPLGFEDITGYKSEPWHYRYVGIENAKKIKDTDMTITEFLKELTTN